MFEGNTAFIGGALSIIASGTAVIDNTKFSGNKAVNSGGAISSLNQSSVTVLGGSILSSSSASIGGAIFANGGNAILISPVSILGNSADSDGGGIFMYSPVSILSSKVMSINIANNFARGRSGAIFASGARAQLSITFNVSITFENNTALTHGGALYFEDAAAMIVESETCQPICQSRGDGVCDLECLTRGCNWDDGDCGVLFKQAAEMSQASCNRKSCLQDAQIISSINNNCSSECFNSSCDWGRNVCQASRAQIATCPILDLVAYKSFFQKDSPHTTYAISPFGPARCANPSKQCKISNINASETASNDSVVGPSSFNIQNAWVYIPVTEELLNVQGSITIELWVKIAQSSLLTTDVYLLSSPNFDVVISKLPTLDLQIFLRFRGRGGDCFETYQLDQFSSEWSEIAITLRNDSSITSRIYLNGSLLGRLGGSCPESHPSFLTLSDGNG